MKNEKFQLLEDGMQIDLNVACGTRWTAERIGDPALPNLQKPYISMRK